MSRMLKKMRYRLRYGFAAFGSGSFLRAGTEVLNGRNIRIGEGVTVGRYVLLDAVNYGDGKILIGNRTIIDDFARLMCLDEGKCCRVHKQLSM